MIIKKFRPCWSYDVLKTEKWLASMAQQGYELLRMNRLTRCFYFQQGEPITATYQIVFDKIPNQPLSKGLFDSGWTKVLQSGKWVFTRNELPSWQIRSFPDREGIVKHNKNIMYIFMAFLIYFLVAILLTVILISVISFSSTNFTSNHIFSGPNGFIPAIVLGLTLILVAFFVYSLVALNKTNQRIRDEYLQSPKLKGNHPSLSQNILSKQEEKSLRSSGQLVMKLKLGWMYAPDRLEEWLESMEVKGYNLYSVGRTGTAFYFKKGDSRKMCYCADLQNTTDSNYFNIHSDSGWICLYKSSSWNQRWVLWGQEHKSDEAKPQIYSDKLHQLKLARRIALTYSAMFLPLIFFYTYIVLMKIQLSATMNLNGLDYANMILFAILVLMFGSYVGRSWLYYNRLRKHH